MVQKYTANATRQAFSNSKKIAEKSMNVKSAKIQKAAPTKIALKDIQSFAETSASMVHAFTLTSVPINIQST